MEWSRCLGILLLVIAFLIGGLWECEGCWEDEKIALLQLKPFFPYIDGWGNEVENCCEWERVECNSTSGQVTKLLLNLTTTTMTIDGNIDDHIDFFDRIDNTYSDPFRDYRYYDYVNNWYGREWYLNASLFLPFEGLKSLYLSGNFIAGCFPNQGFEKLSSKLDKLEILDLSSNYFNESILFSLSELSSLKSLYLGDNRFVEPYAINGIEQISKLKNLELLDLHDNMLGNNILSHLRGFTFLKILYLQNCGLKGTIEMLEFYNMMNLKELYLGSNDIETLSFNQEEGEVRSLKLEVLGLTWNLLNNGILESRGALSSLKRLYIGRNNLKGSINFKVLNVMSNLEELHMSGNKFRPFGFVPFQELRDLSNLKELHISCGYNYSPTNSPVISPACSLSLESLDLIPSLKIVWLDGFTFNQTMTSQNDETGLGLVNLEVLHLSGNFLNNSILPFLKLHELHKLKDLYISCVQACSLSLQSFGLFPSLKTLWLEGFNFNRTTPQKLHNFTNLEELRLEGSSLQTNFLQAIEEFTSLKRLTMEFCEVNNGSRTAQEGSILTNLLELKLIGSSFPSNFIQDVGKMTSLKNLSVSSCEFDGSLSTHGKLHLKNLESLVIQYPRENSILDSIGAMPSLKFMSLRGCELNGTLPTAGICELRHLQRLDTTYNNLMGNLPDCLSNLTALEYLDLSSNQLSGNISALHSLTSLEYLDLSSNQLSGNISSLHTLTSLEYLDLSSSQLSGNISDLKHLTSLKYLDLSSNQFSGNISSLQGLTSLKYLDLLSNQFSGNISSLQSLTSLIYLYLSFNQLSGNISSLQSLIPLIYLDLTSNQLSGNISPLKSLTSLQNLRLSNNYFDIPTSLGPLYNLSKLKSFAAQNNTIYAETEKPSNLAPSFQLEDIRLSCCGEGGSFPRFLYYQHDLLYVDLSSINLIGEFPNWLLENNTKLGRLLLANNSLRGYFKLPFLSHTALFDLDISKNSFYGKIPIEIGAKLPTLWSLNMSKNYFSGGIPASISDMKILNRLDLSNNNLTGEIPDSLATSCSELRILALSNNSLQGQMFSSNFSLVNLLELQLDGNYFSGGIPDCLSHSSYLSILDVSNNQLSGRIPRWMGNMSFLEAIIMPNNHLNGSIPLEFCQLDQLVLLDLTGNSISGNLPSCFSPSHIKEIHLSKNTLRGALPDALRDCYYLMALDTSHNQLSGRIPSWIGGLSGLSYILLNNNFFDGIIPIELCNLSHLSLINLSHNNLSGHIPPCLQLTTLKDVCQDCASSFSMGFTINNVSVGNSFSIDEPIEFTTKSVSYSYKGRILPYMSGIDLSCNNLIGEIPYQIGNFQKILVLNLSHNSLTGPISSSFSNLTQIESLDLSHNNLSGNIPSKLVGLYFLAYFNVSCNNLSGKTPERIAQFGTFDESSYFGNPFLCGEPLPKCADNGSSSSTPTDNGEGNGPIDMDAFYVTFGVAYVMVLLSMVLVLYINPYWRRVWFYHVETITTSCYYFVLDNILPRKFHCENL